MKSCLSKAAFVVFLGASAPLACTGFVEKPNEALTTDDADAGSEVLVLEGGLEIKGQPKYHRVVRLTHEQWENAVEDTLGLSAPPGESSGFIPDPPNGKFSNNERALYVTDSLRLDYQRGAENVAQQVATNSSLLGSWGSDPTSVIQTVGRRAFRRALTPEEITRYQTLWATGPGFFQSGNDFADGIRVFLEAILQSPHFLYRVQLSEAGARLSGYELATKLSFLLRNTTPSEELLDAAESGAIDTDDGLASVASQLIEEAGATSVMERFHDELFGLHRYNAILKSPTAFPTYTEALNDVLYEADVLFFSHLFRTGGGVRSILTSNVAFVNDATAEFYGLSVQNQDLAQIELDANRPGFLTRLGFLSYNANLVDPDPIHRGVDINNRLLCAELTPPPGEIPPLPPPIPGQTNRQRVTAHTGEGVCAGCHGQIINPPGFALEGFDAMGRLRTTDNGQPVDTSGTFSLLEGGQAFEGIVDLAELLAQSRRVHACYSAHIAEYALTRDLGAGEKGLLEAMAGASASSDVSIKELLVQVVTSPRFTTATSETP
jgi:hypothetical protein